MKLRILDDSIRLRLTQSEVATVGRGETVEAWTRFPDGRRLGYALGTGEVDQPEASFDDGCVRVRVSPSAARRWADTDEVGIEASLALDDGAGVLRLLIEKDFRCLAPRDGEDQSDAFAHPDAARGHVG